MPRHLILLALATLCACSSPSAPAAKDAGSSASDAGPDAGSDAGAGLDGGCEQPEVLDPESGTCRVGPVIRLGDCPSYVGGACLLSFIRTSVGGMSTEAITVFNDGELPLHLTGIELVTPAPGLQLLTTSVPAIAPHEYGSVAVEFEPTASVFVRTSLRLSSDAVGAAVTTVPVEAGTPGVPCTDANGCLVTEICDNGACSACPSLTPPPCYDGRLVSANDGAGCPQPVCVCPAGTIYQPGGHCIDAQSCDADGGCASGSCSAEACCSFPTCLCPSGSYCR